MAQHGQPVQKKVRRRRNSVAPPAAAGEWTTFPLGSTLNNPRGAATVVLRGSAVARLSPRVSHGVA